MPFTAKQTLDHKYSFQTLFLCSPLHDRYVSAILSRALEILISMDSNKQISKNDYLKRIMVISIFGKEATQSGHCKTANLISIASVSIIGNLHVYTITH